MRSTRSPAADARRVHRPGAGAARTSRSSSPPPQARGEALDHVLFARAAGARQDDAGADRGARAGRQLPRHLGPGDRKGRRPRRDAHQPRGRATCCSSTRSTACSPAVEEILYPAMEDFQLDLMIGEGPAARSVRIDLPPLHAGRRDDPRGAADDAAARPLRHSDPARFLHAPRSCSRSCARGARLLGVELTADGGARDRAALARHAAHRRPAAAPGARLRAGRRARRDRRGRRPTRR